MSLHRSLEQRYVAKQLWAYMYTYLADADLNQAQWDNLKGLSSHEIFRETKNLDWFYNFSRLFQFDIILIISGRVNARKKQDIYDRGVANMIIRQQHPPPRKSVSVRQGLEIKRNRGRVQNSLPENTILGHSHFLEV